MKLLLIIAVCAGLFGAGVAESGEIKVNQKFSGAATKTGVDTNGDSNFAFAFSLEVEGAPGRSTTTNLTEYSDFTSSECPGGLPTANLVQSNWVQTFSDLSMLYAVSTAGRICFDPSTSEITCEEEGIFTGGTGRFEGATGSWTVTCEIFPISENMNALTGELKGTIDVPRGGDK